MAANLFVREFLGDWERSNETRKNYQSEIKEQSEERKTRRKKNGKNRTRKHRRRVLVCVAVALSHPIKLEEIYDYDPD